MSKERQQEALRQQQQLAAAQAEAEGLRAKLEAALSRRRAVEAEVGEHGWGGELVRAAAMLCILTATACILTSYTPATSSASGNVVRIIIHSDPDSAQSFCLLRIGYLH